MWNIVDEFLWKFVSIWDNDAMLSATFSVHHVILNILSSFASPFLTLIHAFTWYYLILLIMVIQMNKFTNIFMWINDGLDYCWVYSIISFYWTILRKHYNCGYGYIEINKFCGRSLHTHCFFTISFEKLLFIEPLQSMIILLFQSVSSTKLIFILYVFIRITRKIVK